MKQKPYNYLQMSAEDRAMWDYMNAGEEFASEGPAVYKAGEDLSLEQLSTYDQLGPSSMGDITTDPRYKDYEMEALRQLEDQSKNGFTARDQADMTRVEQQANRANRGRQGAIQQNMQSRGLSGSGLDFAMQQQAAQDSAEMEALSGLEKNAQMAERKQSAAERLGSLGGQLQGRDFNQAAQKAQAADEIARFNTANSVQRQNANNDIANQQRTQNWGRTNQTNDRNTQSAYDYRGDKLGVQQGNAATAYNKAQDDYNKAQLRKQQREAKRKGVGSAIGGVAGAAAGAYFSGGNPAAASAGYQAGSSLGGAFANGGVVPGRAPFEDMDTPENDIFAAQLSPGEIVIPKTVANDPIASAKFVAASNKGADPITAKAIATPNSDAFATKPIPEPVLKQLESTRPDLVAAYRQKLSDADKGVSDAQDMQSYMGMANLAGKAFTDFGNSQKTDVILANRMQDLGRAPQVSKAERKEWDSSALDRLGSMGVANAKDKREQVGAKYAAEQKLNMDDPNSEESVQYRQYLAQIAPGTAEKMPNFNNLSASQIQKVAPGLFDKYKLDISEKNASKRLDKQIEADKERGLKSDRDTTLKLSERYSADATTKSTAEVRASAARAEELFKSPTAINDMGLVYSLMKSFDPGSTVREGEFAMAAKSGSFGDKMKAYVSIVESGQMTPQKRAEVMNTIRQQAAAQEQRQAQVDGYYSDLATQYKADPNLVVGKKGSSAPPPAAPAPKKTTHGGDLP